MELCVFGTEKSLPRRGACRARAAAPATAAGAQGLTDLLPSRCAHSRPLALWKMFEAGIPRAACMGTRGRWRPAILPRCCTRRVLPATAAALRARGKAQDVGARARRRPRRRDTPRLAGALPAAGLSEVNAARVRRAPATCLAADLVKLDGPNAARKAQMA